MKRSLVLCLWCGLAVSAVAQTPTVVEKAASSVKAANVQKPAPASPASASPQPSNVKVVAVPAVHSKPTAAVARPSAKPAVVAVQPSVKPTVAAVPAKPATVPAKPAAIAVPAKASVPALAVKAAPLSAKAAPVAKGMTSAKAADPFSKKKPEQLKAAQAIAQSAENKKAAVVALNENKSSEAKKTEQKASVIAHRDPFVSPIVRMGAAGSGCSTGKRCLAIDQIALRGVVKSENGMIAVVVNTMDKAYFLRENDPVFNGYVTKITPDSIIFKETFRDKLGKEMTRDVTKSIIRPVA